MDATIMTYLEGKRQKKEANEESGAAPAAGERERRGMEGFPVEVIGNILSHVVNAKDVVRASATCRKWRVALRHHLHTLRYNSLDCWPAYRNSRTEELEVLLTDTILQTSGLQDLHISNKAKFSSAAVIAWLLHTRESLRLLTYKVPTSKPYVNVLERCGRMRCLESLDLGNTDVRLTADPTAPRFPCLLSLTLSEVNVSALDLHLLLLACQKLKSFSLHSAVITSPDPELTLNLTSSSLKSFVLDDTSLDHMILETDILENLHLRYSTFTTFQLVSKGFRLQTLRINDVTINRQLLITSIATADLEVLEVSKSCSNVWGMIDCLLAHSSSKLRKLRLWGIPSASSSWDHLYPDIIASLFPCINDLGLSYEVMNLRVYPDESLTTSVFEKLAYLELGSDTLDDIFLSWMGAILGRCPNLRRLVVHDRTNEAKSHGYSALKGEFITNFVKIVRQYPQVDIKFDNV